MAQQQQQRSPAVTHWRKVHKRKNDHLLFAEDIGPVGSSVDVEIIDSGVITVEGADDKKPMPWLAFAGKSGKPGQKRLALNVTNCKTMQSLAGTGAIEHWRGWVTLLVVETTYYDQATKKKETTDAIRIAPKRPPAPARKSEPPRQDANTVGSGATQDEPASQLEQSNDMTDEDRRAIELAEREESSRG